ncbi:hypothetical protein MY5147_004654 [Beauveria neobassiana]
MKTVTAIAERAAIMTTAAKSATKESTGHGGGHRATMKIAIDVATGLGSDAARGRQSPQAGLAATTTEADMEMGAATETSATDAQTTMENTHSVGDVIEMEASFAVTRGEEPEKPKEKANFGHTGLLAAASNSVTQADGSTVTLKYHEPSEARKPPPRDQWKLYVFKGQDIVDTVDLSARSCWLVGRDMAVIDLPAEHPSISKQHAVIQFRYTERRNEFGDKIGKVKPYLIDLESANGTMLNGVRIQDSRYLELRDKDMVQFGQSTREYVVMLAPRE